MRKVSGRIVQKTDKIVSSWIAPSGYNKVFRLNSYNACRNQYYSEIKKEGYLYASY